MKFSYKSKEQQIVWYGFLLTVLLALCFVVLSLLALMLDGKGIMEFKEINIGPLDVCQGAGPDKTLLGCF